MCNLKEKALKLTSLVYSISALYCGRSHSIPLLLTALSKLPLCTPLKHWKLFIMCSLVSEWTITETHRLIISSQKIQLMIYPHWWCLSESKWLFRFEKKAALRLFQQHFIDVPVVPRRFRICGCSGLLSLIHSSSSAVFSDYTTKQSSKAIFFPLIVACIFWCTAKVRRGVTTEIVHVWFNTKWLWVSKSHFWYDKKKQYPAGFLAFLLSILYNKQFWKNIICNFFSMKPWTFAWHI